VKTITVVEPVAIACDEAEEGYLDGLKDAYTTFRFAAIESGPASIETYYDEAFAVAAMMPIVARGAKTCDAMVVDCMADPGVRAARELVDVPVVGAAEASMALATQLGQRLGIISILENGAAQTELQVRAMGVDSRVVAIVGIDVPVLALGQDPGLTAAHLSVAARECVEDCGADVIVLGCTGMYMFAERLRADLDVPVVEPLAAAFKTAEMLASLGLAHSHRRLYRRPDLDKARHRT